MRAAIIPDPALQRLHGQRFDRPHSVDGFDKKRLARTFGLIELVEAAPEWTHASPENVGGAVFEAVVPLFNFFARMPVCGLISYYNATSAPEGPNRVPALMRTKPSRGKSLRPRTRIPFRSRARTRRFAAGPKSASTKFALLG